MVDESGDLPSEAARWRPRTAVVPATVGWQERFTRTHKSSACPPHWGAIGFIQCYSYTETSTQTNPKNTWPGTRRASHCLQSNITTDTAHCWGWPLGVEKLTRKHSEVTVLWTGWWDMKCEAMWTFSSIFYLHLPISHCLILYFPLQLVCKHISWSWSSLLTCCERPILSHGFRARGFCVCCFLCLGYPYLHFYAWKYLIAFQDSAEMFLSELITQKHGELRLVLFLPECLTWPVVAFRFVSTHLFGQLMNILRTSSTCQALE